MTNTQESEPNVVRLEIVDSFAAEWRGDVQLQLQRMLRCLKSRREVWLAGAEQGSESLVAKCFLVNNKQEREYRSEIDGLVELSKRDIPCPKLLFTAQDTDGSLWVVTEYIASAVEISEVVLGHQNSEELDRATQAFARALLQHWRLGVHQSDAHLRNFLWDGRILYTIDVGSIRFNQMALSVSKQREIFKAMLGGYVSSFREKLYQEVCNTCRELDDLKLLNAIQDHSFRAGIQKEEAREIRRVWQKSRRECTQFIRQEHGHRKLIAQRDLEAVLIDKLKTAPDELMDIGKRLKSGNTCTVQQIEWVGQSIVVKRYNPKPLFYRIRHFFHMGRAMRSWSNGVVMRQFDVPTAQPLAVVEESSGWLLKRAYFLMEHFDGESIYEYLNRTVGDEDVFEAALQSLSLLFERMRELRIVHGDFKAKNILINADGLQLIDTDGMRFLVHPRRHSKAFKADFNRFLGNWPEGDRVRQTLMNRLSPIFNQ